MAMTIEELRKVGYDIQITGRSYKVVHVPVIKISYDISDFYSSFISSINQTVTGRAIFTASQPQNIPRHIEKLAALGSYYSSMRRMQRSGARVVIKGKLDLGYDFRTRRGGAPQRMSIEQATKLCREVATADYVKQQLLR